MRARPEADGRLAPSPASSNYEQIGLAFRLHAAEVHFNIGLSLLAMGNRVRAALHPPHQGYPRLTLALRLLQRDGLAELADASRAKAVKEHSVIDDCLRDEGRGYTVFSIVRPALER